MIYSSVGKNSLKRIFYQAKLSTRSEGEIRLKKKEKLSESIATGTALHEMLKDLPAEMKGY